MNRDTPVLERPVGLSTEFAGETARRTPWRAFLRKSKLEGAPDDLETLVEEVRKFLGPVAQALGQGRDFQLVWDPPGRWKPE